MIHFRDEKFHSMCKVVIFHITYHIEDKSKEMSGISEAVSIHFQALSGAKDDSPFAYLLFIDEFTILLDCGWSDSFDVTLIQNLIDACTRIDAVLISHPCIEHIGALPYLCQRCGLSAKIFATKPVSAFGKYLMSDHYRNKLDETEFDLFNINDISKTFDSISTMNYGQEMQLGDNIIITPYESGRSIGGAVWRIVKGQNEVIYTNSIYNGKDRHLNGFNQANISQWHPTLWIVDARGSTNRQDTNDKNNLEKKFFRPILEKLKQNKTVLLPVDGLARTLELLMVLNDFWEKRPNDPRPIYFLSHYSVDIYDTVNKFTDWLNSDLKKKFTETLEKPFELPRIRCIKKIEDIEGLGQQPCIILATSDTLERGFSRQLFIDTIGRSSNLIFFTTAEPKNSLAEQLRVDNTHRQFTLIERHREELQGVELIEYNAKKDAEQAIHSSESDESDSDDHQEVSSITQATIRSKFQFSMKKKSSVTDYGVEVEAADYAHGVEHAALLSEAMAAQITAANEISVLQEPELPPSKYEEKEISFFFDATSQFYSFEARSNFFTLQQFLMKASPSHVIIIGGSPESTMTFHKVITDELRQTIVSTPSVMEQVYLTRDQASMRIGISRALYHRLDFKKIDDHNEVAYIDANLTTDDISGTVSAKPVDHLQPHLAQFVGKIELPLLRDRLTQANIKNTGMGSLICGPWKIEVKQISEKIISVEGIMCPDFIKIRNIIQDMLPMV